MIDLKSTALFTFIGAIGIFWNQAKQIFARISSYVIVRVELQGSSDEAFISYCWKHFRYSKFGARRFTAIEHFIRPKDRQGLVAFEMTGEAVTFFDGWKPIFVSAIKDKNDQFQSGMKVSVLRGTVDVVKLVGDAVKEYDEETHTETATSKRYYVQKFFGRRMMLGNHEKDDQEVGGSLSRDNSKRSDLNPLSWKREELGAPTSDTPFQNLSYDDHIKAFQAEIARWKESEVWYKSKGLNWRFGAGIFGPPGTGKTSFVRAIGQEFDMPIHIYDLTTMDNEELVKFWRNSLNAAPCIVLFEDLDRIFDGDKNIKSNKDKSLTLDCLLNCINGVEPANGILLLVTANNIDRLDPALGVPDSKGDSSRPGRLDRGVYFGPLNEDGRIAIAKRILSDCQHLIPQIIKEGEGETGAQFENRCAQLALKEYWGAPKVFSDIRASETLVLAGESMDEIRREGSYDKPETSQDEGRK